ncbi:54S ribosomal protein L7, mitochondrial [[Candida] jaroonii]|uniref:54S ribosomal protein L7, mitochondrial n=1 Tax=[Candida] jaroonii TaxID=467808 RepID=A0ACA9YBY7_9ASCO|nr:54S ribosomal protein L7, mitochondrial [[Candida] jaroonii]
MNRIRLFSTTTSLCRAGYSTVEPVHHLVPIRKSALKPGYKELLIPKDDIRSVGYKPKNIQHDRVNDYYENQLKSDLMLRLYEHDSETVIGSKLRPWETDSPYKLYRRARKPKGFYRPQKDIKPVTFKNVPELTSISINLYSKEALEESWVNISTRLQIAQITNAKPKRIYNKSNVLPWKVRQGKPCGCKVELVEEDMTQFLSTLTELVLPRIRTFKGISKKSGDKNGNITFGLNPDDIKFFPEIENFQDLYPNLFGFHITFKTSARTDDQARLLLSSLGLPFN